MPVASELLARQGLTAEEYERIDALLGREPNALELALFGVMWSEHCSYKSSRLLLRRLPTEGERVVQGPGENAGVIDIGGDWVCIFKIESHNHPSFVEPFQGAATGVGGILRDIFTMGARPVAIMDSLRFGPVVSESGADDRAVARNQAIVRGVVGGIAHYGNCFGVANVGGETSFDACYAANPLVNAFALGIARRDAIFHARAGGEGNPVIYVGAKTGRDGIHGATMASEEFSAQSESKRPNVQVGDPFLEKLLLEACLEAMATGAVVAIQDMGAAGLTSSSCEMGGRGDAGIELDLDGVPCRESGMTAEEMMLSESQERMLLVAARGREEEIFAVFRKWGLDAAIVGRVTAGGCLSVRHHGTLVAEVPNAALTTEAPRYRRSARTPSRALPLDPPPLPAATPGLPDPGDALLRLLAAPRLASKRWIYEQYDSMVRTNTLTGPGGGAGVVRVKDSTVALAMALDGPGRYCRLEPREGARLAVAAAARKVATTGARPAAATNCLNLGNPEKPEVMWQLAEIVEGLREACLALETPITGGNVSLYNETLGQGIDPTPVVGVVGILDLAGRPSGWRPPTAHFHHPDRAIVLLDAAPRLAPPDAARRFGSSEYAAIIRRQTWGLPPALDLRREAALERLLVAAVAADWIESARQVGVGGLAVCLAQCALSRAVEEANDATEPVGVEVDLVGIDSDAASNWEHALFGETASRVVVSCLASHVAALAAAAERAGVAARRLGVTRPGRFEILLGARPLISLPLARMAEVWNYSLENAIEEAAVPA